VRKKNAAAGLFEGENPALKAGKDANFFLLSPPRTIEPAGLTLN